MALQDYATVQARETLIKAAMGDLLDDSAHTGTVD